MKKDRPPMPPGLFDLTEPKEEEVEESKSSNAIDEDLKPLFNTLGFDYTPVIKYEQWGGLTVEKSDDGSNLQRLFPMNDLNVSINVQMYVLRNVSGKALGSRARFHIPASMVDSIPEHLRVGKMLELLKKENMYMFLFARPKSFVLIKFSDIPVEGWHLTYRKDRTKLNRMYVKTKYLKGKFKHISQLKRELTNQLYENK